jgi:hypothetical protein
MLCRALAPAMREERGPAQAVTAALADGPHQMMTIKVMLHSSVPGRRMAVVKPSDRQELFRRAVSSNTSWSRHIASKLSSYRLPQRTLSCVQGFNLRGAFPNLALKLNAAPGAPLEKQTAAKAPESARRRGEVCQATSHMWYTTRSSPGVRQRSPSRPIYSTCTSMFATHGLVLGQHLWRLP